MRPLVATVVSAAPWEHELVAVARAGAAIRVARRCHTPSDVERILDRVDVVVVGAETSWLSAPLLRRWRSVGVGVVGMVAAHDRPGREILHSGGACDILEHTRPVGHVIASVASMARRERAAPDTAPMATVIGSRGSPGCSEVALSLAWAAGRQCRTLLVELDGDAPGLGLRLGIQPSDGLGHGDPAVTSRPVYRRWGPIEVLTWPARRGPLSQSLVTRVLDMARHEFDAIVVDAGPATTHIRTFDPGRSVLVVQPSPRGLVRAGRLIADWDGGAPLIVANRVPPGAEAEQSLRLVRAATGLEPIAIVPELADIGSDEPEKAMVDAVDPIARAVFGTGQRSAAR